MERSRSSYSSSDSSSKGGPRGIQPSFSFRRILNRYWRCSTSMDNVALLPVMQNQNVRTESDGSNRANTLITTTNSGSPVQESFWKSYVSSTRRTEQPSFSGRADISANEKTGIRTPAPVSVKKSCSVAELGATYDPQEIYSYNPTMNFYNSMLEMVIHNNLSELQQIEDMLACFLALNSLELHSHIEKAFKVLFKHLLQHNCVHI